MMRPMLLRGLAIGLAFVMLLSPATAQKLVNNFPADKFAVSPGGVDLNTGRYAYSETDLSVGAKDGGLTFTRTMPDYSGNRANPFGSFSHNFDIFLIQRGLLQSEVEGFDAYQMTLHFGSRVLSFKGAAAGTTFGSRPDAPLSTLTLTSGGTKGSATAVFTAVASDGTMLVFRPMGGLDCDTATLSGIARRCA